MTCRRCTGPRRSPRGVFVNPALTEPFGLTLIEAAGCGVPIVATRDGGPEDITANCRNGVLVDVTRPENISKAIRGILADRKQWKAFSTNGINGVREHYTWEAHCKRYVETVGEAHGTPREEGGR